jgi:tetratricopeptide (TPR) repeat protein
VVAQAGPAPSQVVPELEEGSLLLTPAASERLLAGAAVPFDRWLRAAPGEDACVRAAPGGKLCASPGSLLRLRHGAHLSAEVASGRLRLGVATGASISVPEAAAPAGDPEAARLRVTVDGSSVLLVVLVGPVLLEGPEGPRILTTGEEARLTFEAAIAAARRADEAPTEAEAEAAPAAQPPAPAPALSGRRGLPRDAASTSPAELLAAAQELRAAGDLRGAKSAYAELVRKHPSSAEARAALPSLGDLQLRAGRPRDALRTFEAYLQGGGATVEEARRGRIAALGALGRRGDEVAAIAEFLAQHPDSLHAGRLRARLGELESAR